MTALDRINPRSKKYNKFQEAEDLSEVYLSQV